MYVLCMHAYMYLCMYGYMCVCMDVILITDIRISDIERDTSN